MKRSVLLIGGALAVAATIVLWALLQPTTDSPALQDEAAPEVPPKAAATSPAPTKKAAAVQSSDEGAAKALFEAATTAVAFREVWLKYPTTSWGKRAEERYRALDGAARATVDRGFEEARARAAALPPAEAVAAWKAYAEKAPPDARPKAEAAAVEVENRNRAAYNDAVAKARELPYAQAAALFEALAKGSTAEVAARCAESAAQLRKAAEDAKAADLDARREAARAELREHAAPKALAALKARRYAEALKELGDVAPLEAELKEERRVVELAKAYWDAFLKAAQGRSGQDVVLHFAGKKKLAGKLTVDPERATLETPEGPLNVPLDQLTLDQVSAWTLGKTLPVEDPQTHLKAAMFYFAEGRDDLASIYLATAKEKGVDIAAVERVWREGYLRAALWAAEPKQKPKQKPAEK